MNLSNLFEDKDLIEVKEDYFNILGNRNMKEKKKLNLLALGDVGSTLLIGLKLMGGDVLSSIGITDINEKNMERFETEINQISMPFEYDCFPNIEKVSMENIFDCDIFVFCATKGVPKISEKKKDVRMAQFDANKDLVQIYAKKAVAEGFKGDFYIVSDPVDPLCKAALLSGLGRNQVRGFGLGVMNARAAYYSKKDSLYKKEGRVFGPHGEDLVVANSINDYDEKESIKLTKDTVESNLRTRELGFKPYIAPAMSSGAISILENLRGNWHYSSLYFGKGETGAFLGAKNKKTEAGDQVENTNLQSELYMRIKKAYDNLKTLI